MRNILSLRNILSHTPIKSKYPIHKHHRCIVTVNEAEVNKFSNIGNQWWDSDSLSGTGPLHAMNACRVSFLLSSIESWQKRRADHHKNESSTTLRTIYPLKNMKILDIGCGGGLLSESLARLGGEVTGIDPSIENIQIAQNHASKDPKTKLITYKALSLEEFLNSQSEKFDIICCLEVIEHVDKPLEFLRMIDKILKDDGSLFISTINRTAVSFTLAIAGAEYLTGIIPPGTHDWRKFITPDELTMLVRATNSNLDVMETKGMVIDVEESIPRVLCSKLLSRLKWKLSDDVSVNYITHFMKKNITE